MKFTGGGGVKSVQRGTADMGAAQTLNVTISSVNMAKAFVSVSVTTANSNGTSGVRAELTSSTNLALRQDKPNSGNYAAWEVVEGK